MVPLTKRDHLCSADTATLHCGTSNACSDSYSLKSGRTSSCHLRKNAMGPCANCLRTTATEMCRSFAGRLSPPIQAGGLLRRVGNLGSGRNDEGGQGKGVAVREQRNWACGERSRTERERRKVADPGSSRMKGAGQNWAGRARRGAVPLEFQALPSLLEQPTRCLATQCLCAC